MGNVILMTAASWALGQVVENLLSEDPDQPVKDDKPTTLSNRGDYLPLLIGRERMGAFFAWAGNRYVVTESTSNQGKGHSGGGVGQETYFEYGTHFICVGPATAIHRIWRNGELITGFSKITPETHPDGTTIELFFEEDGDTLKMGDMIVYWGFRDGEKSGTLNNRTGIDSAYPGVLRIVWQNMRLGGFPQWPLVEYDVEVPPYREDYVSGTAYDDATPIFGSSIEDWLTSTYGPAAIHYDIARYDNSQGTAGTIIHVADSNGATKAILDGIYNADERITIANCIEEPRVNGTYKLAGLATHNPSLNIANLGSEVDQNLPDDLTDSGDWTLSSGTRAALSRQRPSGNVNTVYGLDGVTYHDPGANFAPVTRVVATVKLDDGITSGTFKMILRDLDNGYDHAVIYTDHETNGYTLTVTNGGTAEITALGYGWRQITFTYRAGEGSLPSSTTDELRYVLEASNSSLSDYFLVHTNGNSLEAWHTPFEFALGTTSFELDTYLPNIPTEPFTDGDCVPWLPGFGPEGPNPASALHQLLFAPAPYGAELNKDWFKEDFDDTPTLANYHVLRQLAVVANTFEGINAHVLIQRGDTFQSAIDNFLLDMGWMISWSPAIARYVFTTLRDPNDSNLVGAASLWEIPDSLLTGGPPETVALLEDIGPNRISYTYKDVNRNYKTDSVVLSADGQIEGEGIQRQDDAKLFIARDRLSAEKISKRRGQIDIYKPASFTIDVGANGKLLYPGNTFIFEDSPDIPREDIFRVIEVTPSQTEGGARVVAAYDIHSLSESTATVTSNLSLSLGSDGESTPTPGVEDLAAELVELPAAISNSGRSFSYLRIRANDKIRDADVHVSRDDTTYSFLSRQQHVVTGGELLETWDSSVDGDVEDGPLIKPLGPDFTRYVKALDAYSFGAGRQVAVINDEWFFVRSLTAEDHGTYRLTHFHGGKYGSSRAAHAIGDKVFIFDPSDLPIYRDVLAAPGVAIYAKGAPRAKTRVELTDVSAVNKTLTGVSGPNSAMIHSGDETDLAATYPPADYGGGSVMLQNSVSSTWQQFYSDGTSWNLVD